MLDLTVPICTLSPLSVWLPADSKAMPSPVPTDFPSTRKSLAAMKVFFTRTPVMFAVWFALPLPPVLPKESMARWFWSIPESLLVLHVIMQFEKVRFFTVNVRAVALVAAARKKQLRGRETSRSALNSPLATMLGRKTEQL